jgi:protein SDA1
MISSTQLQMTTVQQQQPPSFMIDSTTIGTTQQRIDVTLKLPQLQNLCKRDPIAYRDDYDAQVRRLMAELSVLTMSRQSSTTTTSNSNNNNNTGSSTNGNLNTSVTHSNHSSSNSSDSSVQRVVELIQFVAAVASSSYKGNESDNIATMLIGLLGGTRTITRSTDVPQSSKKQSVTAATTTIISTQPAVAMALHRDVRRAVVSALILMRNKGTVPPLDLLQLFFSVMSNITNDKTLKELLYRHMVNDIRNINKKGKRDDKVNRSVQTFLHRILQSNHSSSHNSNGKNQHMYNPSNDDPANGIATETASKRAVDMVCELYRRRVWTDDRTVAILASAVENVHPTVSSRAMRFFLGIEEKMAEDMKSQKEMDIIEKGQHVDLHLHSRKTSRRARQTDRALKNKKRAQQKKEQVSDWMDETPNNDKGVEQSKKLYPAIELLRDPQGLAEILFRRLKSNSNTVKYETKILMINFITRLAGNHELLILPLYSYLQKYMSGHQRDVTAILAYTVQACHNQVPPEEIYGIIKTIAHNFITERCSEEQMAVGINAVRAICARVPACMVKDELTNLTSDGISDDNDDPLSNNNKITMDMEAFARDIASYANHRDRSVAIAGKAWLNFVREVHPALLQGKDRGLKGSALYRSGEAKPARYGEFVAPAGVEGADLLVEYEAKKKVAMMRRRQQEKDDNEDPADNTISDGEWEDVEDDENDNNNLSDGEWEDVEDDENDNDLESDDDNLKDEDDVNDDGNNDSGEWEDVEDEEEEEAPDLIRLDVDKTTVTMNKDDNDVSDEIIVPDLSKMTKDEREQLKQQVSSTRIFTTEDFIKMKKLVERENRAKRDPREAARRKRAIAQGKDFIALSDDENDDDNSTESETESIMGDERGVNIKGTVNPQDIMATSTRKRQSRADKLEKVLAGRTKFETKGRAGGSTNIEKKRKKNFIMSKFSTDARTKGRGKSHSQSKKRDRPKNQKGTHEAKKRRRKM